MTAWSDLEPPPRRIGAKQPDVPMVTIGAKQPDVPMVTIGAKRRSDVAYLNAAARHALGDPQYIRWQSNDGLIGIVRADFISEQNGGTRYNKIDPNGLVSCTPVLSLVTKTPVTLRLALHGERLVAVARVERA